MIFFLILMYETQLYSSCHPEKKNWVEAEGALKKFRWHLIKIWVDFTGYPSNHYSVLMCRSNRPLVDPTFRKQFTFDLLQIYFDFLVDRFECFLHSH